MKLYLLLILILILPQTQAILEITEVNYNPEGDDNNLEYIEVYTDQDLTGFNLRDFASEDTLNLAKAVESNYALIVEDGFDYTNIEANIYTIGATIGNNLNNNEDLIILLNNSEILETLHYYSEWGADGNGKSLCKINNQWLECSPTPGQENSQQETNIDYNLEITEFMPNPAGNDDAPIPNGEWIELYNYGDEAIDLTGFMIKDQANHVLIVSDVNTENTIINSKEYKVIYINGKSGFLNNEDLEKITLFDPTEQEIDKVSYSYSSEETSWAKVENFWVLSNPTPGENNPDFPEEERESKIEINKIYLGQDNCAKFGETIRIRLNIYKGDETKNNIKAHVEKDGKVISKTTSFNIEDKYSENDLTIPLQLIPNCNLKESDGDYYLIVEGLDEEDKEEFCIAGITEDLCDKEIIKEEVIKTTPLEASNSEIIINQADSSIEQIVYESKNKKITRSGIYFFSVILVLLIINLVREKWKK